MSGSLNEKSYYAILNLERKRDFYSNLSMIERKVIDDVSGNGIWNEILF